jgi:F-type H+-transporting ATPase subunit a
VFKSVYKYLLFTYFVFICSVQVFGTETATTFDSASITHDSTAEVAKKFDVGEFVFDHILDSHEWHILTFKGHHVNIPLPIILYSKTQGFVCFSSKKFQHGHETYKGFKLNLEGEHKGKITEILPSGEEDLPLDISITKNVAALLFSVILLLYIFLRIAYLYKRNAGKAPKGMQNLFEPIILFVRDDIAKSSIGEKKYEKYLPYLLTVFFFVWFNNMLGLVPIFPGGANVTGNIAITMVLAVCTFVITMFSSNKNYWVHIFNMPGVPIWLKMPIPLIPFIELFSMFSGPIVLMVRLFANITAGHIIALGFISLIFILGEMQPALGYVAAPISVAFMIFMMFLELLIAFIQAYIITFLSALFIGGAVEESHSEH